MSALRWSFTVLTHTLALLHERSRTKATMSSQTMTRGDNKTSLADKNFTSVDAFAIYGWSRCTIPGKSETDRHPIQSSPNAGFKRGALLITNDPTVKNVSMDYPKLENYEAPEDLKDLMWVSDCMNGAPKDMKFVAAGFAAVDFVPSKPDTYRLSTQLDGELTIDWNGDDDNVDPFDLIAIRFDPDSKTHDTYTGTDAGKRKPILYAVKRSQFTASDMTSRFKEMSERAQARIKHSADNAHKSHGSTKFTYADAYNFRCEQIATKIDSAVVILFNESKNAVGIKLEDLRQAFIKDMTALKMLFDQAQVIGKGEDETKGLVSVFEKLHAIQSFAIATLEKKLLEGKPLLLDASTTLSEVSTVLSNVIALAAVNLTADAHIAESRNIVAVATSRVKSTSAGRSLDVVIRMLG